MNRYNNLFITRTDRGNLESDSDVRIRIAVCNIIVSVPDLFSRSAEICSWKCCKKRSREFRKWNASASLSLRLCFSLSLSVCFSQRTDEEQEVSWRRNQSVGACRRWVDAKEVGRVDNRADISNSCPASADVERLSVVYSTYRPDLGRPHTPFTQLSSAAVTSCRNHFGRITSAEISCLTKCPQQQFQTV